MSKIYAFDYMLSLFENWYNEENKEQNKGFENCSKLSMLKLLFLTAVPKEEGARDLLDIFDNFHALPYGPKNQLVQLYLNGKRKCDITLQCG